MRKWSWNYLRDLSFGMWGRQRKDRWQGSLRDIKERNVFTKFEHKNYSSSYSFGQTTGMIMWQYVLTSSKPSLELFLYCLISLGYLFVISVDTLIWTTLNIHRITAPLAFVSTAEISIFQGANKPRVFLAYILSWFLHWKINLHFKN